MKKMEDKFHVFECSCLTPGHSLRVVFDTDTKKVYVETQLTQYGFFKRLYYGFKYIFGARSKYSDGHWEETVIKEEDFVDLFDLMSLYSYKAGIRNKSAKKIKKALDDVAEGKENSAVKFGLHTEKERDILAKKQK